MSAFELRGRKALVTGGAQGLGEAMAAALREAGADVVIADVKDDAGHETAKRLGGPQGRSRMEPTYPVPKWTR